MNPRPDDHDHRRGSQGGGDLEGRVALVTGAAQGIGAAVVRALAAQGARVAALDANTAGVDGLAAEQSAVGRAVRAYHADVGDPRAVEAAVAAVETELGPIAILVNVAGVLRTGPVIDIADEDWAAVFSVNTDGVFHLCRSVARRMVGRRSGVIVTVGSNVVGVPRTHMAAYAASKAASSLFTKCLGLELAEHGIRCNVVSPGSTDTPMQRSLWTDDAGGAAVVAGSPAAYRAAIPLGRLGQPSDVADAVEFLVSDHAAYITMNDLYVDGGAALKV
jgi:2,3-dihydro-2,3-dihydroxybenzoate dehydrogenase